MDEPIADVLPYVRNALRWAHEANPNARLLINDYRIIPANKYRDRYRELVALLKQERAPLHAIDIQAHSPGNGAHWFSPEEIWQTCELFGTQLGYPIYFTEFWQVSDPQRKMSGARAAGHWSLEPQADAIEQSPIKLMQLVNVKSFGSLLLLGLLLPAQGAQPEATPAKGPPRIHPRNPRYFTDGTKQPNGSLTFDR